MNKPKRILGVWLTEPNIADQFPGTAAELEAQYGPSEPVDKGEKEVG